jgi:rod shape determining protein RodA
LYFNFKILSIAYYAKDNFESMLVIGILIYFDAHLILHIGINLTIFPVTGITMPFMSYGGSHLLVEFISLGIINSIRRTTLKFNRNDIKESEIII